MCQVQAGANVSPLMPGETKYSDCYPRKTTTYILHVVSITTHTHNRRKSIGEKETEERKEDKGKERKDKKNETKQKRQAREKKKTRRARKDKTKKQGKKIPADPSNWLSKKDIWLTEGITSIINGTWEKTQHGEEVRAVLCYLVTAIKSPTTFNTMMAKPRLQSLGHDAPPSAPPPFLPFPLPPSRSPLPAPPLSPSPRPLRTHEYKLGGARTHETDLYHDSGSILT